MQKVLALSVNWLYLVRMTSTNDKQSKSSDSEMYLDYVNNFLTVDRFAEHYGLSPMEALRVIRDGREAHNANASRQKAPTRAQLERWIASKGYPTFLIEEMLSA